MKKLLFVLVFLVATFSMHAQLANTRWKGMIYGDHPRNLILDFKKDIVSLYTVGDSELIETMHYNIKGTALSLQKIEGQSDCDNSGTGVYTFEIKSGQLFIKLSKDDCYDRSSAVDKTHWSPWKYHPEIKLTAAVLKQYVGVYQMDAGHPITVSFKDGRLYATGPNNNLPESALYAETDTRFLLKAAGAEWDFVKDANGKVVKLISHEDKDYELKKVK